MVDTVTHLVMPEPGLVPATTPQVQWRVQGGGAEEWIGAEITLRRQGAPNRSYTAIAAPGTLVAWPFDELSPLEEVTLTVRAFSSQHTYAEPSESVEVQSAALPASLQTALLVSGKEVEGTPPQRFSSRFDLESPPVRAWLFSTGHGIYEADLNGASVDDHRLKPGWSDYEKRMLVDVVDVSGMLRFGNNRWGATVTAGWFAERYGYREFARRQYEGPLGVLMHLIIDCEDGVRRSFSTDESWHVRPSKRIVAAGLYAGEVFDAREDEEDCESARGDEGKCESEAVQTIRTDGTLELRTSPPVRHIRSIFPTSWQRSSLGRPIADFGENVAGVVRLSGSAPRGTSITLRHAEVLDAGELSLRPLRTAAAADTYVFSGQGHESWAATFTYHGFRYCEVEGWPADAALPQLELEVLHTDLKQTSGFSCSDERINNFHANVIRSAQSNFMSIPTDCPQRDERWGWTGDMTVFADAATLLFDSKSFLSSWLREIAIAQNGLDGTVPVVVPNVFDGGVPVAGWGDVATVLPWVLYETYGDLTALRDHFPIMTSWVERAVEHIGDSGVWDTGFQFGDWLDPAAPPNQPGLSRTDDGLVASAYLFRSLRLVHLAAIELEEFQTAQRYERLADALREAFLNVYCTPAGRLVSHTQTAYALALVFGLAENDRQENSFARHLVDLVKSAGYRLQTGFLGTPHLLPALEIAGAPDAAMRVLQQTQRPSWLSQVAAGATTVWERWDSLLPDGSVNPGEMTSFNHYSLGSVVAWLYRALAGFRSYSPSKRRLVIAPYFPPSLEYVSSHVTTPQGVVTVHWFRRSPRVIHLRVDVPPGLQVALQLPQFQTEVSQGVHELDVQISCFDTDLNHPYTLETSLSELIRDERSMEIIATTLEAAIPGRGERFVDRTRWVAWVTLGSALGEESPALQEQVLNALNRSSAN